MQIPHWSEIMNNMATSLAILIGGGWTFWKFVINRERFAKPEFDLDLRVIGRSAETQGEYLIELAAIISNKSSVRLLMPKFHFSLLYLEKGEGFIKGTEVIHEQILFKRVINKKPWLAHLKRDDEFTFVDPSTTQRYTYVTSLPASAAYALLQSSFDYKDGVSEFHSAQKCFNLET